MAETLDSIQKYLDKVYKAIDSNKYRVLPTTKNNALVDNYLLNNDKIKKIIKSLVPTDFSEVLISNDEFNKGHHLYVFGKSAALIDIFSFKECVVDLYIKFDQENAQCLIVLSLHKQEKAISYYFK